jgi:nucleoside-diphosphate-sugar epimerase
MKIGILGGTGFLGKNLSEFLKKNHEVFVASRRTGVDGRKVECLLNWIQQENLDCIINLAAEVNFITRTKKMHKVNSLVPKIFAQYCKKYNKHLIQASGTLVNGIHSLYNHKTKLKPINAYGKTKLIAEKYIQKTKCNYTIIRFGGIYGRNGSSHLGINNFINQAINKKKIIFSGNSKSKRNYIFVEDAARSIINCMIRKKFGIFYLGGEVQTFKVMLKKINLILGSKKEILFKKNKQLKSDHIVTRNKIFKITSFAESLKTI